LNKKIIILLLS